MKSYGTAFRRTSYPEEFLKEWRQKNRGAKVVSIELRYEEQQPAARSVKKIRYDEAKHVIND